MERIRFRRTRRPTVDLALLVSKRQYWMPRTCRAACLRRKTLALTQPAVSVGIVGAAPGAIPSPERDDPSQVTFSYEAKPSVARVAPRSAPSGGGVL